MTAQYCAIVIFILVQYIYLNIYFISKDKMSLNSHNFFMSLTSKSTSN
jgi:hypothetical protein